MEPAPNQIHDSNNNTIISQIPEEVYYDINNYNTQEYSNDNENKDNNNAIFGNMKELHDTLQLKARKIKADYLFAVDYLFGLINIIKYMSLILFDRINNSLQDSKSAVKSLKEISVAYSDFSNSLSKHNKSSSQQSDEGSSEPKICENIFKSIIHKTQGLIYENITIFSSSLKNILNSGETIVHIDQVIYQISQISKEMTKMISKLENRITKLQRLYINNYDLPIKVLDNPNLYSDAFSDIIESQPDFILIELDLRTYINKLYLKTNLFLTEQKNKLKQINGLLEKCNTITNDLLQLYLSENKKLFSQAIISLPEIERLNETNPNLYQLSTNSFIIEGLYDQEKDMIVINDYLNTYQKSYQSNNRGNQSIINNKENYLIETYETIDDFYDFLLLNNPNPDTVNNEGLYISMIEVKRFAGFFSGWKNSILLISKQRHIMIFDDIISPDYKNFFELSKVTIKPKQDKTNLSNLYQFEISNNQNDKSMMMSFSLDSYLFDAKDKNNYDAIFSIVNLKEKENTHNNQSCPTPIE